ncbi:glycosyltransferase [Lentimicrobium sp.]
MQKEYGMANKKLRILWFTNTAANADEYFNSELKGTGGWLKSLDQELQHHLDLNIAFYHSTESKAFQFGKTKYYPIFKRKRNLFQKYKYLKTGQVHYDTDIDKYLSIIDNVQPDLIHIHGTEINFGCLVEHVNIPVVISIQGILTVVHHKYFKDIGKKFLKQRAPGILGTLGYRPFWDSYVKMGVRKKQEQRTLASCKHIIGRTDWDKNVITVLTNNANYYHSNEILRSQFYLTKWAPHKNEKKIIWTTTVATYYKGFETLFQAVQLLNSNLDIDFEWRVAGIDSADAIVRIIKKQAKQKGAIKQLKLLGKLSEKELIKGMLESDIYVTASHIENSPNGLCEAMLLGMPCIATHAGGTNTIITDKKDGILIQDGDPWSLAGAIINLLTDEEKMNKLSINAYKTAQKRHDKKSIVNNLLDTYNYILQDNIKTTL